MRRFQKLYAIAVIFMLMSSVATAQLFSRKHARKNEHPPKAILVQLPTYQNRAAYLTKTGNEAKLNWLKRDADSMAAKIILDFTDNFSYCPVYFFYDSNADKIRNRQFAGVLLSSELQPIQPVLSSTDTNYVIALFGLNMGEENTQQAEGSASAGQNVNSDKQRLQVFDRNYKKLKRPLPNGTNNLWGRSKRGVDAYKYESPTFNIYYHPYVAQYNAKLHVFYGAYPY